MPGFTLRLLSPENSSFLLPILSGVCKDTQKHKSLRSFSQDPHDQKFAFVLPTKLLTDNNRK